MNNLTKQQVEDKVFECLSDDDYVFGGYVRNAIENKPYNDIDVFLNTKGKATIDQQACSVIDYTDKLQKSLQGTNWFLKTTTYFSKSYHHSRDIYREKLAILNRLDPSKKIELDLITCEDNDPFRLIDFDLNCLYMKKDKVINAAKFGKKSIIDNIKNKKFRRVDPTPAQRRFDKFAEMGYTEITETKNKEINNMAGTDKKMGFMEMTKEDATEAAYRVGATQLSRGVKTAIVTLLKGKGVLKRKAQIDAFNEVMDTPFGEALVSAAMGYALTYAPMISEDPRAQRLAKEFRVGGMAIVGNEIMGIAVGQLLPEVQKTLATLPAVVESKVRVTTQPHVEKSAELENAAVHEVVEVKAQRVA